MTKKVYMLPELSKAKADDTNSINQIVVHISKELPKFGWDITEKEHEADIVAAHAGQTFGHYPCDIAHCHGLYPTFHHKKIKWHFSGNVHVINNLRHAKAITVPSAWVAEIIQRELNRNSMIVPWATDFNLWSEQTEHHGYTLWNKTRISEVCDPTPIEYLA